MSTVACMVWILAACELMYAISCSLVADFKATGLMVCSTRRVRKRQPVVNRVLNRRRIRQYRWNKDIRLTDLINRQYIEMANAADTLRGICDARAVLLIDRFRAQGYRFATARRNAATLRLCSSRLFEKR